MTDSLDRIALHVLSVLRDEQLYKSKIAEQVDVSGGVVTDRIEMLLEKGHVEPRPAETLNIPRNVNAVFATTDAGESVLVQHRVCTACNEATATDSHDHSFVPATEFFTDMIPETVLAAPDSVDRFDVAILDQLMGEPLWKQKLFEQFDGPSVQTVGRRVNRLQEAGYVEATLMQPEEVDRQFITGYETTTKGAAVVEAEQAALREAEACRDCGELFGSDDHRHEFVSATEFFAD